MFSPIGFFCKVFCYTFEC